MLAQYEMDFHPHTLTSLTPMTSSMQIAPIINNNALLLQRVTGIFLQEMPKQMKQLTENVKLNQNLRQTQRLLHTIKGDSRTIGALHLADIAYQAEQAAHSGQWTTMATLLPQLKHALFQLQHHWNNTTE